MKSATPEQPTLEIMAPTAQAMERAPQTSPALQLGGVDINALLNKAIDSKAAVEIVKELRAMALEDRKLAAKDAFDHALASFQADCPVIKKQKFGAKQAYKYCPLDEMIPQVQPLLLKHGFSFTLTSEVTDGFVRAILELKCAGHAEKSEFKVPVDTRNPMMNEQQRYGGAMTFAKRYAFCNALGIMTGDDDNDGNTRQRPAGPAQGAAKAPEPGNPPPEDAKAALDRVWKLLKPLVCEVPGWNPRTWDGHNAWLRERKIITKPETRVESLPMGDVKEIIDKSQVVLSEM